MSVGRRVVYGEFVRVEELEDNNVNRDHKANSSRTRAY
jgi:hypothetical protein